MALTDSLRISPLPNIRPKRIPVAVLKPGGSFIGENRARMIYCDSAAAPLRLAKRVGGTAVMVRTAGATRWVKFTIDGVEYFPGSATTDIDQIISWRDYCYECGISARSIQAMSFYLMRYTLGGFFEVARGNDIPFNRFPTGARMHAVQGVHTNVIQSDITAAYLWGIGKMTPAKFLKAQRLTASDVAENKGSWALVKYRYTSEPLWGPLPHFSDRGYTVYPTKMGKWSNPVLLSSGDIFTGLVMGVRFQILKSWLAAPGISQPFRGFMNEIWERRIDSKFPSVAKQAGNTLWGNFCAGAEMGLVTFNAGTGKHRITKIPARSPLCLPIGYSVVGKLRSRLYQEAISTGMIHAHTDGVMGDQSYDDGEIRPGSWRRANSFVEVEILTPSWYRIVKDDGEVVYKMAGRKGEGENAARLFNHHRDRYHAEQSAFSKALSVG